MRNYYIRYPEVKGEKDERIQNQTNSRSRREGRNKTKKEHGVGRTRPYLQEDSKPAKRLR